MQKNHFLKFITLLMLFVVLCVACTIPFYFESPSIYYKTGIDKFMLRAGKIGGIIAAMLMFFQLIFVGRFSVVEKIWNLKKLFQYHRINGVVLLTAALIHPVLILGADHFVLFPFESKYWPEFTGILLLITLVIFVGVSHLQKKLSIDYKTWLVLHKLIAPGIFFLMFVHVFNVSRTFESGVPFYALLTGAVIVIFLIVRKCLK